MTVAVLFDERQTPCFKFDAELELVMLAVLSLYDSRVESKTFVLGEKNLAITFEV